MEDKLKKAIAAIDEMIEIARTIAVANFEKGGQDLTFEMVASLNEKVQAEISKGIWVQVVSKSENELELSCRMEDKAELDRHVHSDYDEIFTLLNGKLFDLETKKLHENKFVYKAGEWHNLVAIGDCHMSIICKKVDPV